MTLEQKTDIRLRYYALRACNLVNILRAYDGSGIPMSDSRHAFTFLREFATAILGDCSFNSNAFDEYKTLEREHPELTEQRDKANETTPNSPEGQFDEKDLPPDYSPPPEVTGWPDCPDEESCP